MQTFYDQNGYHIVKSLSTDDELVEMRERIKEMSVSPVRLSETRFPASCRPAR